MLIRTLFHCISKIENYGFIEIFSGLGTKIFSENFIENFEAISSSYYFCDRIYSVDNFRIHGPYLVEKLRFTDFGKIEVQAPDIVIQSILDKVDSNEVYKVEILFEKFIKPNMDWYCLLDEESIHITDKYYLGNPYVFYRSYIGYNQQDISIIKIYLD